MKRDSELRDLDADSQWDFSALKGTRLPLPTDFLQTSTRPEDDAFVFFYANPGESGHIPKLLAVGVTDAQFIRDSKSGSFTVYKIVVQTRETKWSLIKRYSELRDFHKKVTKIECDSHFPYFPDKQIRNRFDQFVVERRKREITTYLRKLFRIAEDVPQVQNVVNEFFEVLSLQRFALSGDLKMVRLYLILR